MGRGTRIRHRGGSDSGVETRAKRCKSAESLLHSFLHSFAQIHTCACSRKTLHSTMDLEALDGRDMETAAFKFARSPYQISPFPGFRHFTPSATGTRKVLYTKMARDDINHFSKWKWKNTSADKIQTIRYYETWTKSRNCYCCINGWTWFQRYPLCIFIICISNHNFR